MTGPESEGSSAPARFVRTWSRSLRGTACLPMLPAERDRLLAGFAGRLAAALSTERFDPVQGQRIGADLVAAGFATPEVLGRTIATVSDHLVGDLAIPEPAGDRLAGLVDALACGFATAVRDRALDAQETVITVALTARARAEQALRASEARALHLATHDPVTGLPNRTVLTGRLSAFAGTARPGARLGVCCIDLDRFAAVNHTLGHPAGNRLLVAVADRLRTLAGAALVARLEGDQFAILVEDTTCSEDAVKVADQALTRLAEPFHVDDVELPLTASAGIAEGTATDAAGLVQAAQIALHWAKADGRARWRLYQQERADADTARYRLSAAMPGALERGEFTLDYQPLVDLAGGELVGAEALARWRHPELGRLPAHRFIDLAEHTGLVVPLGNRLLAQACQQAARWRRPGPAPYVSVNLAAAQLHDPGFVGYVAQTLDHTGLSPDRLQLEITERAVIDPERVSGALAALMGLGVRLAIDDFGTAYSNLIRLRDLPLSTLKLDGALVPRGADRHDGFLATVVELGHTLGLSVTAEGIETAEDARRMREAGCDTGQGWHLGYPVPADELTLSA
jgi:diguanylate cyclase (GGDEF)-like protein